MTALHRLQEEDPALAVRRDDETHQTLLGGMGETHLAIVTERLARKFGVEVETEPVVVAYRETITGQPEAEGKYKKQTGGHGQFGVASCGSSRASAGRASSSSTRSSAAPSPASSSPPCRRASRRPCPAAGSSAARSSTCR